MDFWDAYKKMAVGDFFLSQITLSTNERQHTSLNMVQSKSVELTSSTSIMHTYRDSRRYIIAREVTYDLCVSVYDVNKRTMMASRFTRMPKTTDWARLVQRVNSWKSSNVEIRTIGFQNKVEELPNIIDGFKDKINGKFMEIDLFGSNIRHIVFDMKTGVSYNLLLLNRIYRAGELACQMTKEEYDKSRSDLVFR